MTFVTDVYIGLINSCKFADDTKIASDLCQRKR